MSMNKTAVSLSHTSTPVAEPSTENIKEAFHPYGKMLGETSSSMASSARRSGIASSNIKRIVPRTPFWVRWEYYLSVGRVQNVTESYVLNVKNREHYYDDTSEGAYESQIKMMEEFDEMSETGQMIEQIIRNWIVCGVHIVSPKDWVPLQLQSLTGKTRNENGVTTAYLQLTPNGTEIELPASEFLELPFIDLDREPWGTGMFDSLMNRDYLDVDGRQAEPILSLYRQAMQDNMRIHHKFASPRVIYTGEGVDKEVAENDIIPVIENMKAGNRAFFNQAIDIKQETVDGNTRFIEAVMGVTKEVDAGLQSSSNRIITEPSAMADAREAGFQDDDRVLAIMEKLRLFFNKEVIPRITGLEPGLVVWKWGAKDAFDIEYPEPLQMAVKDGIISSKKAAIMLEEQYHWKIPTDEDVLEKFGPDALEPEIPIQDPNAKEEPNQVDEEPEPPKDKDESFLEVKNEDYITAKTEEVKLSNRLKNEKILFIDSLNRELKELKN